MQHLSSVALAVSLTTVIAAQEAVRRPSFVLAAGLHSATALIEQVGLVRKVPIKTAAELRDALAERSVHVPVELRLAPTDFDVVATNVLLHEGVLLVADAGALRPVLLARCQFQTEAFDAREPLGAMAVDRTPEEVLAGTRGIELVRTRVSLREAGPPMAHMMLRVMTPRTPQRPGLVARPEQGELVLTGTTDEVGFALRMLQVLDDPASASVAPAIKWTTSDELPWPGGRRSRAAFDALVATTLDASVLDAVHPTDAESVDLGDPAELSPEAWFARATEVYGAHDTALLPVVPQHRVFVRLSTRGDRRSEIMLRAVYVPAAHLDEPAPLQPVITRIALRHIQGAAAQNDLRAAGIPRGISIGSIGRDGLLLTGMRADVATTVAKLRDLDTAK